MDAEFKRKDLLVHRLAEELKRCVKEPPEAAPMQQWTIAGVYAAGTTINTKVSQSKLQQQLNETRKQLKEMKAEYLLKENELLNTQMSTKYLRLTELETQVTTLTQELARRNT